MYKLITKYQLSGCEDGEYYGIAERNIEETIQLIQDFDWKSERQHLSVDVTGAGICIENELGDFLKICNYYHHKYIVYYYDHKKRNVYYKIFETIDETLEEVRLFFQYKTLEGYTKENKHFANQRFKFSTNDFIYESSIWKSLKSPTIIYAIIAFIFIILPSLYYQTGTMIALIMCIFIFSILIIPQLPFLIKFNSAAKGYQLIISRGKSDFHFGKKDSLNIYNKTDILYINEVGYSNSRHPLSDVQYIRLTMKDGTILLIPNTIIDSIDLAMKLDAYEIYEDPSFKKKWPWLKESNLIIPLIKSPHL